MGKIRVFAGILLWIIGFSSFVSAADEFPLTITDQMNRQSAIDKKVTITLGKYLVQERYRQRVAERNLTNTMTVLAKSEAVQASSTPSPWIAVEVTLPEEDTKVTESPRVSTVSSSMPSYTSAFIPETSDTIPGVNMNQVRSTWLGWYNEVRGWLGVTPYALDSRLDRTAQIWATVLRDRVEYNATNVHKRDLSDGFYDYDKITDWFAQYGVIGVVRNRATTTENVGFWYYSCDDSDCTDELIQAVRGTFDFFMSEKSYNGAHYRSIVQPNFTKMGISIQVDPSIHRFYIVVHYITDFE